MSRVYLYEKDMKIGYFKGHKYKCVYCQPEQIILDGRMVKILCPLGEQKVYVYRDIDISLDPTLIETTRDSAKMTCGTFRCALTRFIGFGWTRCFMDIKQDLRQLLVP